MLLDGYGLRMLKISKPRIWDEFTNWVILHWTITQFTISKSPRFIPQHSHKPWRSLDLLVKKRSTTHSQAEDILPMLVTWYRKTPTEKRSDLHSTHGVCALIIYTYIKYNPVYYSSIMFHIVPLYTAPIWCTDCRICRPIHISSRCGVLKIVKHQQP